MFDGWRVWCGLVRWIFVFLVEHKVCVYDKDSCECDFFVVMLS